MVEQILIGVALFLFVLALTFGSISSLTHAALLIGKGFLWVLADLLHSRFLCKTTPPPLPFDVLLFRDTTCLPLLLIVGYACIAGGIGVALRIIWGRTNRVLRKNRSKGGH